MMYEHKKTAERFELIGTDEKCDTVMIQDVNGKTKNVGASTFKRWYKKIETEPAAEVVHIDVTDLGDVVDCTAEPAELVEETEPTTTKKERRPRAKKEMAADAKALHDFVLEMCEKLGGVVFVPAKDMKFRGLKAGKHMFVKYHWTNTSVILQVRAVALGLDAPKHPANHTFNDKYIFTENTEDVRNEISRIMTACYNWQVAKNLEREAGKKKTKTE